MKSFFEAQFSYCPLILIFSSRTLNNRINKLHERSLRILYRDDTTSFKDLLEKDNSFTIHERNVKVLGIEMYKVANDILPNAISDFINKRDIVYNLRNPSIYQRERVNTSLYGTESLRILGPKIWDIIPGDVKGAPTLNSFKRKIKNWKLENCPCRLCKRFIVGLGFL